MVLIVIRRRSGAVLITDVGEPASADLQRRQRRYLALMSLRLLCLGLMFVVPGVFKFVALAGAAILPAIAVLLANNVDKRTRTQADEPPLAALTAYHGRDVVPAEVSED